MYAIAGFVYDENDNAVSGVTVNAFFIKRKSNSSPSKRKKYPVTTNGSGYFSFNLADVDFLTTDGKYDTDDEVLVSVELGDYYARIVHVVDTLNEYNSENLKLVLNKNPVMGYDLNASFVLGNVFEITGTSYKDEASFFIDIKGVSTKESQKRTYDIFEIFPKNKIVKVEVDWGEGGGYLENDFDYIFSNVGEYTVTVKSTDGYEYFSTQVFVLRVFYEVSTYNVCDTSPITHELVTFSSVNSGHVQEIVKTEWFVDGVKVGEGDTLDYVFPIDGKYKIKNRVYYNNGFEIVFVEYEKEYDVIVTLFLATDNYCEQPYIYNREVSFKTINTLNAISRIVKTEWFVDGVLEYEGDVFYKTFDYHGNYKIKNRVYYNNGFEIVYTEKENDYEVLKQIVNGNMHWTPEEPYNENVTFFTEYNSFNLSLETINIVDESFIAEGIEKSFSEKHRFSYYGLYQVKHSFIYYNGFENVEVEKIYEINVRKKYPAGYDFDWIPLGPTVLDNVEFDFYNKDSKIMSFSFEEGHLFYGEKISGFVFRFDKNSFIKMVYSFFNEWDEDIYEIEKEVILSNIIPVPLLDVVDETKIMSLVKLRSDSYDTDGNIIKHYWKVFNSSKTETLFEVSKNTSEDVFWNCFEEGKYVAWLEVTDEQGGKAFTEQEFEIVFDYECGGTKEIIKIVEVPVPYLGIEARREIREIKAEFKKEFEIKVNLTIEEYNAIFL